MHNRHGSARPRLRALEIPWAWCLSFFGAALVALLGAASGGSGHRTAMLVVFAVLGAGIGAVAPFAAVLLVAGTCWCFYDGFFVHRHGRLGAQPVTDLRALGLLAAVVFLGWVAGYAVRWRSLRQPGMPELNPLLRPTDRARARLSRRRTWLLVLAAALGIGAGAVVGIQEAASATATRERAHEVTATTLAPAIPPVQHGLKGGGVLVVRVPVRWQYPAGVWHTGEATVLHGHAAGTPVPVWVDAAGKRTDAPAGALDSAFLGLFVTIATAGGGALLVVGGVRCARRRLDHRDASAWAQDWARVEPDWSGRRRNHDVSGF
jgi:hypothetical protein